MLGTAKACKQHLKTTAIATKRDIAPAKHPTIDWIFGQMQRYMSTKANNENYPMLGKPFWFDNFVCTYG